MEAGASSPDDVRADMESLNTSKEDKKEEKKVEEEEDIFQEKVSRPTSNEEEISRKR